MKIYLLCIIFFLWGMVEVKAGFRITGKISDTKTRKEVFLLSGNDTLLKANVKGGIFKLKGKTDFPKLTFLAFEEKEEKIPLFLENTDFTVNILSESVMVEGGTHQKCWNSFQQEMKTFFIQKDSLRNELAQAYQNNNIPSSMIIRSQMKKLDTKTEAAEDHFIKTNDNIVAAYIIQRRLIELLNRDSFHTKYELLGESARNSEIGKALRPYYENQNPQIVGMIAPDFTLDTPDGTPLSLYSIKSKVKILDFWASWCGPCRAENPHVVRLYDKYKDKGLEILSVSLDNNSEAWQSAIKKDNLPWKHVSDLKGWACSAAALYGIKSVPYLIVLDQDNRIAGIRLRGEDLDKCLEKLFE